MKEGRYSIEVFDEMVLIYGHLSIREAFDFISFFDQQGFNQVTVGQENSTLCLIKTTIEEQSERIKETICQSELNKYKRLYEEQKEECFYLSEQFKMSEATLRNLQSEEFKKYKELHQENQKLIRATMLDQLSSNPEVKEILDRFAEPDYPPAKLFDAWNLSLKPIKIEGNNDSTA